MPKKLPPYVDTFRDRHGKKRFYFRRDKRSPRIPLPSSIGSPEFMEAYKSALDGALAQRRSSSPAQTPKDSIAALIKSYMRSTAFLELRPTTKPGYLSRLEALRRDHGERSVSGMTRERIATTILGPYVNRPGARLAILKMLRVLIRHAVEIGWLDRDPSLGIKRPKTKEIRSWTETEIAQFESVGQLERNNGRPSAYFFTQVSAAPTCGACGGRT